MTLPSGEQFEIRYDDQVAVVTEVGATIRRYDVGDRAVLDGFAEDEVASGGRGQQLVPWPNRVRDGRYRHEGQTQQLALSEPANGNAIHGLARWAAWRPVDRTDAAVTLGVVIHQQPGWPGVLSAEVRVELGPDGLTVTTTARNDGRTTLPYGTGAHPYLAVGSGGTVDSARLTVPAAHVLHPDDRGIPVDPRPVSGTAYDFTSARPIGDLVLDTAYREVTRDSDDRWRVRLDAGGTSTALWGDAAYGWIQVFSGDTLSPERRRRGLAVEPMTCGPDAFNTGVDLVVLAPGQSHRGQWGIEPF